MNITHRMHAVQSSSTLKGKMALYTDCVKETSASAQKKTVVSRGGNHVKDDDRFIKACESGMDYVYKVTVVGMDLKKDSDIYELKVEQVLKEGTDEDVGGKK
ncbi:hypothetical protein QQF64_000022 [Cirrhinus molitorella]|uniref:Netrin module non-TIMP type domain-containing protein n=1 Tax=Cirrhinus molitorella TaxID=172907 RepID=A0ABR3NVY8_9TELE